MLVLFLSQGYQWTESDLRKRSALSRNGQHNGFGLRAPSARRYRYVNAKIERRPDMNAFAPQGISLTAGILGAHTA